MHIKVHSANRRTSIEVRSITNAHHIRDRGVDHSVHIELHSGIELHNAVRSIQYI